MKSGKMKEHVLMFVFCAASLTLSCLMMPLMLAIVLHGIILAVPFLVFEYLLGKKDAALRTGTDRPEDAYRKNEGQEEGGRYDVSSGVDKELLRKGIYACWIRKDGICNIRTSKGYRRAGSLPGFPNGDMGIVRDVLNDDGWRAERKGQFLYLEWKKG